MDAVHFGRAEIWTNVIILSKAAQRHLTSKMSDNDRTTCSDEVDTSKSETLARTKYDGTCPSEESPNTTYSRTRRNVITVPANVKCPDGYKLSADGVCREVW